jgi:hypothetical protein
MNIFWNKKDSPTASGYAPYEEIDSKKTSKLGYFFLILMVIFGVAQGNNFLWALQDSINSPKGNSQCMELLAKYAGNNTTLSANSHLRADVYYVPYNECVFSDREKLLTLDKAYQNNDFTLSEIRKAEETKTKLSNEIRNAEYNRDQVVTDYQLSLLESIAGTQDMVFNQDYLQTGIVSQDEYIQRLTLALSQTTANETALISKATKALTPYQVAIEKARSEYQHETLVHKFIQFILSLLLILPLFIFVWKGYHAAKNRRSEFGIIWGGLVATAGILLAQILLVFIYEILPQEILQEIFAFLAQIKFVWALLYWLGFILVPLFFGFLIYLIQKKFYNKQAVMMRAVKNAHCPNCSMKTHKDMNNCPVCGCKLKAACVNCGAMTMSGGTFCEICGTKHGEPVQKTDLT